MAGKIWQRGKKALSEAVSDAIDNDETQRLPDPATAGEDGLTGPELAAEQAHAGVSFADLDEPDLDEPDLDGYGDGATGYVNPDNDEPTHSMNIEPAARPANIDGLARQLVLKGYESLQRTPSPNLNANYRAQLLHLRELVTQAHKHGIRGVGKLTATIIGLLATDQRGKVDAKIFLTQLMRQAVWQSAVEVERWRNAQDRARRFGEDDARPAPMGMDGMSDHADAIQGVAGSSERELHAERDVLDALVEVNAFLSAFADAICDDENDRIYLGLESGLPYIDKPGLMAGSWVGVFDAEEAIDIQLIKNRESMVRRDEERAARRRSQLAQLAAQLDA